MVAAAILAGGQGRRLGGIAKPLMVVDGQRIIDRQLAILRPRFDAIVIVTATASVEMYAGLGVDVVADRLGPGLGPLAGLDAALTWLPPQFQSAFCVAGDMPFLVASLVERMRDAPDAGAVVPRLANGPEPLCARYHRSLGPLVAAALAGGMRAMHAFLDTIATVSFDAGNAPGITFIDERELRTLDPALRTFANVNTPDDLGR